LNARGRELVGPCYKSLPEGVDNLADFPSQAAGLESLARQRFRSNLSEAELALLRSVLLGEPVYGGPNESDADPTNDPSVAAAWGSDREIRAELIRWLCIDDRVNKMVDPRGINLHACRIRGELDLSFATVAFPLTFWGCCLDDTVFLTHAKVQALNFARSYVRSVSADGIDVAGGVFLHEGFVARGRVEFRDARIGGNLLCDRGSFVNSGGKALLADRATVTGSIFLRNGFSSEGEVRLLGAHVGSNLDCEGGRFRNPGPGRALSADRIDVAGGIFLRHGFLAEGSVRLLGARIGGDLDCQAGAFKSLGGPALYADGARVEGSVFLRDGFSSEGGVVLLGAQIGGGLDCRNGAVGLLDARMAVVKGTFRWANVRVVAGTMLDLRSASMGVFEDEEASWPEEGNLSLDGFTYGHISGGPTEAGARLKWLERQEKFTRQPYRQLAKVLRDSGSEPGARRVLFEMEDRSRREQPERPWFWRCWDWMFKLTVGYGYKSEWALVWLAALILVGSMFLGLGYLGGVMTPSDKDAYAAFAQQGYTPAYYTAFNPLVYSVEHSFPLISLGIKDRWQPGPGGAAVQPVVNCKLLRRMRDHGLRIGSPGFLRVWIWMQTIAGWVLATLFVAGLTGIVKSD
jgi:hypothetical protein